jgi:hypothetical protein
MKVQDYEPSEIALLHHFKSFGTKFLGKKWSRNERAVNFYAPANGHKSERDFLATWAAAAPAGV